MKVNLKRSELDEMIRQVILESIEEENNEGVGSFMKGFFGGKQGKEDMDKVSNKVNSVKNKARNIGNSIKNAPIKAVNTVSNNMNKLGRNITNRYNDGRNSMLANDIETKWEELRRLLVKVNRENPTRTFKSQLSGVNRGINALLDGLRSGEEGYGYKEE